MFGRLAFTVAVAQFALIGALGCAGHRVIYLANHGTGLIYGPFTTREERLGRSVFYYVLPAEKVSENWLRQKRWLAQPLRTPFSIDATGEEAFETMQQLLTDENGTQVMCVDVASVPMDRLKERVRLSFKGGSLSDVMILIGDGLRLECFFDDGVLFFYDPIVGLPK